MTNMRIAAVLLAAWCTSVSAAPVPGYAPADGDFRLCQTLRGALIGGSGAFIGTGLIGIYRNREVFDRADGSFFELEPVAVAATTAGFFGAALGGLFGYATGIEQTELRAADSAFVPPYATVGPRILMIFSNNPRFHLCWRKTAASPFVPDRVRAGFIYRPRHGYAAAWWAGTDDRNADDVGFFCMELDGDLQAVWNLPALKKLSPYTGCAAGYARARHFDLDTDEYTDETSPYLRLLAGIEVNAADYLYLELEGMYEVYGTQRLLKTYGYHPSWNSSVYLYIGSYFF